MVRSKSATSYVAKALRVLATGEVMTMEVFIRDCAGGDERRAARMLAWMQRKEGAQFQFVAGATKRSIATIRLVNVAEMVEKLKVWTAPKTKTIQSVAVQVQSKKQRNPKSLPAGSREVPVQAQTAV